MIIRVAAIGVSHWHALHDAAYLRHLVAMPDVRLVGVQVSDPALAADVFTMNEAPLWQRR